jgi:hypothetical protein
VKTPSPAHGGSLRRLLLAAARNSESSTVVTARTAAHRKAAHTDVAPFRSGEENLCLKAHTASKPLHRHLRHAQKKMFTRKLMNSTLFFVSPGDFY